MEELKIKKEQKTTKKDLNASYGNVNIKLEENLSLLKKHIEEYNYIGKILISLNLTI